MSFVIVTLIVMTIYYFGLDHIIKYLIINCDFIKSQKRNNLQYDLGNSFQRESKCTLYILTILFSQYFIILFVIYLNSMPHYPDDIEYSDKYIDEFYQYRHVQLPKEVYKKIPRGRLLTQNEWRALGVQQSRGWVHYELHKPEPHILLFRRPKGTDPQTGLPPSGFIPPPDSISY